MRISVFGLGYVGAVSAACLARNNHEIVGIDVNPGKVQLFNAGVAPVIEPGLAELMEDGVKTGRLRATTDATEAVNNTDLSIVCVGTPSRENGSLDLRAVEAVSSQIGEAIAGKESEHTVVMRSTMLPGSMHNLVQPALEKASGMKVGKDFGLAFNPEFLRESTAIKDFDNPPKTVIGSDYRQTAEKVAELYEGLDAPLLLTSLKTSEMVKYADNVWHALKVCFGNEIGNICKAVNIDSHEVMDIFCQDTKLNISPYYLKPGYAFGGSCLPKDTRALQYLGKHLDLELPIISNILESNRQQMERALKLIIAKGKKRIGVLGISFKAGTDDLRESPQVMLVEQLIGKGFDVRIYDENVRLSALTGANKEYIENTLPHVNSLMVDTVDEIIDHGELVLIGNNGAEFANISERLNSDQILVDLVRIEGTESLEDRYDGINW